MSKERLAYVAVYGGDGRYPRGKEMLGVLRGPHPVPKRSGHSAAEYIEVLLRRGYRFIKMKNVHYNCIGSRTAKDWWRKRPMYKEEDDDA